MDKYKKQTREIKKNIRFSPAEWARVEKKMQASGLTCSKLLRRALENATITKMDIEAIKTLRTVRGEMTRIGSNINLIARHGANVKDASTLERFLHDLQECNALAAEYTKELDKLIETIR